MKGGLTRRDTLDTDSRDEELRTSRTARLVWWLAQLFKLRRRRKIVSFLISLICRMEGGEPYSRTARDILSTWYEIEVGTGSYGSMFRPGAFGGATTVGRYTSIAPNVHTVERNHPLNWPSTSSVFYDPRLGVVAKETLPDYEPLQVGHDVWIGWGAIILPGCRRIGDGAVIGAGSVVTRNIPDFAIVTGVPAQILRYRFDEATRNELTASEWWTLTPSQLRNITDEFLHEISASNISRFQTAVHNERRSET